MSLNKRAKFPYLMMKKSVVIYIEPPRHLIMKYLHGVVSNNLISRVAVGMRICGNSHGKTHRFPYGTGMGMTLSLWVFPHVGFPVGLMWVSVGFMCVFPYRMENRNDFKPMGIHTCGFL